MGMCKKDVSKTMVRRSRTAEEVEERYRAELPRLIEEVKKADKEIASCIYKEVRKTLLDH